VTWSVRSSPSSRSWASTGHVLPYMHAPRPAQRTGLPKMWGEAPAGVGGTRLSPCMPKMWGEAPAGVGGTRLSPCMPALTSTELDMSASLVCDRSGHVPQGCCARHHQVGPVCLEQCRHVPRPRGSTKDTYLVLVPCLPLASSAPLRSSPHTRMIATQASSVGKVCGRMPPLGTCTVRHVMAP